jgi:hypothetical protein
MSRWAKPSARVLDRSISGVVTKSKEQLKPFSPGRRHAAHDDP